MKDSFHRFAHRAADVVGSPAAFITGLIVIAVWVITGPAFHYSDTWQLVINTGTTIITFLMVFSFRTHKTVIRARYTSSSTN